MPNIKKMFSQYENQDLLKNQPFYNDKIEQTEKNKKKYKKTKKRYIKKWRNKLTKYKILRNILPMYNTAIITRKAHDFKGDATTYDVEVRDRKSLKDHYFQQNLLLMNYLLKYEKIQTALNIICQQGLV